ncbi:MAG: glycerol kinase GlpK [Dehalococcoidia bacterium]|nr:glycerol kinase GlpK [Dehalococcoidia bacterium]MDW8119517.1 glycerol kinase GlpK [Chloroflexota bacterium]
MAPSRTGYILGLDQGTGGTFALLLDETGQVVATADIPLRCTYPQPGWVEQDADDIYTATLQAARSAVAQAGITWHQVAAIGITNQRETTILWERGTGRPVAPAIVWQCRRTAPLCESLRQQGLEPLIRERTGLVLDAYFSASKIRWLLDTVPGLRPRAERGDLCFGTVDSWLLFRLSGGSVHATDASNASRTLLLNLRTLRWDEDLLHAFAIPASLLPQVLPSSVIYGYTDPAVFGGVRIPLASAIGDQQAALFGQACLHPGMAKVTYGTGAFVLVHTGETPTPSRHGLLTTVAWLLGDKPAYALEGSVFTAGAAIQWLRDGLGLIGGPEETVSLAQSVADTGGVYVVPAFVGLGAPHWDMYARGTIVGLTQGTSKAHLVRAVVEAIAYQVRDVMEAVQGDTGRGVRLLRADGGGSRNPFLMQFQADLLGVPLEVPLVQETTALGAAYLAGIAVGVWAGPAEVERRWVCARRYVPSASGEERQRWYRGWLRAVERARGWAEATSGG